MKHILWMNVSDRSSFVMMLTGHRLSGTPSLSSCLSGHCQRRKMHESFLWVEEHLIFLNTENCAHTSWPASSTESLKSHVLSVFSSFHRCFNNLLRFHGFVWFSQLSDSFCFGVLNPPCILYFPLEQTETFWFHASISAVVPKEKISSNTSQYSIKYLVLRVLNKDEELCSVCGAQQQESFSQTLSKHSRIWLRNPTSGLELEVNLGNYKFERGRVAQSDGVVDPVAGVWCIIIDVIARWFSLQTRCDRWASGE